MSDYKLNYSLHEVKPLKKQAVLQNKEDQKLNTYLKRVLFDLKMVILQIIMKNCYTLFLIITKIRHFKTNKFHSYHIINLYFVTRTVNNIENYIK